ncbi:MAG TPA: DEAD/DEAH box helicase [Rhodanobacteraceae bacterium]|nr:DEAD/DEAH box helicase [Rhodanobacteraceae bacterium]
MQQPRSRPTTGDDPPATPEDDGIATPAPLPGAWRRALRRGARDEAAHQPARGTPGNGALGFFLELVAEGHGLARLEAAPVLLSRADQGHARAHPLDARRLAHAGLAAGEQRLATAVLGLPHSQRKGRNYAQLAGAVGDGLLADMLDQGACFLGGVAGLRLARGQPETAKWRWEVLVDGDQRLSVQLPGGQRAIRVGGLWSLDPERAELAPLRDSAGICELLQQPPLSPAQARAFATALPGSALAGQLPPPTIFDPPRACQPAPKSVLTLHALTRHPRLEAGVPPLAFARLAFDYGSARLPSRGGETLVRRVRNGKLVEISRRRAEELAAMERLESVGLTPVVDCEGLPWDVAEVLPEDAWVFPGAGASGALEVNTPARWLALRPRLEPDGFVFDYAPSFPFEVLDEAPRWFVHAALDKRRDHFNLQLGIALGDERINLLPGITEALAEGQFQLEAAAGEAAEGVWYAPLDDRRRVPLRLRELRALLLPLAEYLDRPRGVIRLPRAQAGRLGEIEEAMPAGGVVDAPASLTSLASRLLEASDRASDAAPAGFVGELRRYQHEGLRWLNALAEAGLGGVLADDMGLGKTVQLLAHLLALQEAGALAHPALVVAPTSLIPNWQAEAERYAPGLRQCVVHGAQRGPALGQVGDADLVITSYALLPRDIKQLKRHRFSLLVLDEAQLVKNPRTLARRAATSLRATRCLCMTGTPLENHLGELWSQLDLAVPGLLGDERGFRRHYRVPIEKHADADCQARLNRRVAPFILRRSKSDVARELPPKTEITRHVSLGGRQRALYEQLRQSLADELREVIAERGIEHSGIVVLDALLKLRQVCCDPRLVKLQAARGVQASAKFELLMHMLPELVAEDRRILVFSQFTEMLELIASELDRRRMRYVMLTGDTRDRAAPVRRFQEGKAPLFLLSLKAGGVGLNLTAADTVIHYDPWWNPAAEAQASDRAHRIGQDKPVFVYRLICSDTVEQRIEALKARKAELAAAVLEGGGSRDRLRFDADDLDALFEPGAR